MTGDHSQETLTDEEQEQWRELLNKPPENLTAAEITSKVKLSIKRRFAPPEWEIAFELASPNGRRADAIAVNTFPSRNFKIIGFEFKASRSDWLSEKHDGAKAEHFVNACDEWYVVAGGTDIVEEKELPEGWGLLELKPNSEQLWKVVESDLTAHQQGEPDRAFWGRFLQKTVGGASNFTQQDVIEARKRGYEEGKSDMSDRRLNREAEKLHDKAETADKLRDAGLGGYIDPIDDDEIQRLKKAKQFIQNLEEGRFDSLDNDLDRFEDHLDRHLTEMLERVAELNTLLGDLRSTATEPAHDD